jgi:hypothetical protein
MPPARGGRKRKAPTDPPNRILVGFADSRTWAVDPLVTKLALVAQQIPRLPMVGVKERTIRQPPYSMMPVSMAPCSPAVTDNGLVHVKTLEDARILTPRYHKAIKCPHQDDEQLICGVCPECQPQHIMANAPFGGVWYQAKFAIDRKVLPRAALPSDAWVLFRLSVPCCAEPWRDLSAMAAGGHLAHVSDVQAEQLAGLLGESLEELAGIAGLTPSVTAVALWRLFGTNELLAVAATYEITLARHIVAHPQSVFEMPDNRTVWRSEWHRFATSLTDRRVACVRPRDPPYVEYSHVCDSFQLTHAIAATQMCPSGSVAWINLARTGDIELAQLQLLVDKAPCGCLSLTFGDNVRHVARYIQFKIRG